jgi:hypothetical protein
MWIRHIPEITLAGWYKKNISHPFPVIFRNRYHIIISLFPGKFSLVKYSVHVCDKKIIAWPFSYYIPHQPVVLLSVLEPAESLADIYIYIISNQF